MMILRWDIYIPTKMEKKYTSGIEVTWNQDKDEILTVDQQGQITPIKPGIATVTVTGPQSQNIQHRP